MHKILLPILLLIISPIGLLYGQDTGSFSYKLLETNNPQSTSVVKFYANAPAGVTAFSWEFGQGGATSTDENPQFTYDITGSSEFTVTLDYPGLDTPIVQEVEVSPAFFVVETDIELGGLASLKRVFRSAYFIEENEISEIGNMRFEWTFEIGGSAIDLDNYQFNDPNFYHFPNIYHTFNNGGVYTITLRVHYAGAYNIYAEYSRGITLEPVFGANRIDIENIPNVFTPNNDGVNDFFMVETCGTTPLVFKVFTRSGAIVFEKDANVIKWDGKNYFGQDLPQGIYYYLIQDKGEKYNPATGFFYLYR